MASRIETNIKRVRKSVADEQGRYIVRTRALARALAAETRDNIRFNVQPRAIGGVFEGYAMTSTLWRKVVASEPIKQGKGWVATVRVLLTGRVKRYALIHEVGGKIRAKNAPYLIFKIKGQWVQVKEVTIRAKHYFQKGVERTRKEVNLERLSKLIR